jgi:hypothetical protein
MPSSSRTRSTKEGDWNLYKSVDTRATDVSGVFRTRILANNESWSFSAGRFLAKPPNGVPTGGVISTTEMPARIGDTAKVSPGRLGESNRNKQTRRLRVISSKVPAFQFLDDVG